MNATDIRNLKLVSAVSAALKSELQLVQNQVLVWERVTINLDTESIIFEVDEFNEEPCDDLQEKLEDIANEYEFFFEEANV